MNVVPACYRTVVLIILLALLVAGLTPLIPANVGAQTGRDEHEVAEQAIYLSQLEAEGRFDTIYDLMHADSKAISPMEAVVGWYRTDFAPLLPQPITEIREVRFVGWTWGVTGDTYPNTAEIDFVQPFGSGSNVTYVEETVRLVEESGEWRWFFGRSREFVNKQIERFAPDEASASAANAVGAEDACDTIVLPRITGAGLDPPTYASAFGCRWSPDGTWYMPVIGEFVDPSEEFAFADFGIRLLTEVDVFSTADALTYSVRYYRNEGVIRTIGPNNSEHEVDFGNQPVFPPPNWLNNYRDAYEASVAQSVMSGELVGYVQWYASRRDRAIEAIASTVQNPTVRAAFLSNWEYLATPWPWQLSDPAAIHEYSMLFADIVSTEQQAELRILFQSADSIPLAGGCVAIAEMGQGREILFICDNDSFDRDATLGTISTLLNPGSYSILVSQFPEGMTVAMQDSEVVLDVPIGGAEWIVRSQ